MHTILGQQRRRHPCLRLPLYYHFAGHVLVLLVSGRQPGRGTPTAVAQQHQTRRSKARKHLQCANGTSKRGLLPNFSEFLAANRVYAHPDSRSSRAVTDGADMPAMLCTTAIAYGCGSCFHGTCGSCFHGTCHMSNARHEPAANWF